MVKVPCAEYQQGNVPIIKIFLGFKLNSHMIHFKKFKFGEINQFNQNQTIFSFI